MIEFTTKAGIKLMRSRGPSYHTFWLIQNPNKNSEWAQLAKQGHAVKHLFWNQCSGKRGFVGFVNIDNITYDYNEARRKFIDIYGKETQEVCAQANHQGEDNLSS
jgi:hypothetical protein